MVCVCFTFDKLCLYCLFLVAIKVVEEEKGEVVKKNKSFSITAARNLGQHYPCRD